MRKFLITYDLLAPGKDYKSLFGAIEGLTGYYWHGMQNIWFVKGNNLTCEYIIDQLVAHVDANDKLFACELDGWWSKGLDQSGIEWLKS